MPTWIDVCRELARDRGIDGLYVDALRTFGNPFPRGGPPAAPEPTFAGSFDELERALREDDRISDVAADLSAEIDDAQASMFERRVRTVETLLAGFDDPTGRLLRVGLLQRLGGILEASRPRAPRVRALADFYWSYAGWHEHLRRIGDTTPPSVHDEAGRARWHAVADGVEHACLDGLFAEGPSHVNLLRLEPGPVCLRALDARPHVRDRPFDELVAEQGALAGTSGGFFLYSEADIEPPERRYDPVGLLVTQGRVVSPPVFPRGAIAVDKPGRWMLERIAAAGMHAMLQGQPVALDSIVTRAEHRRGPGQRCVAIAAGQVVAVGERLRIPLGGFVLPIPPSVRPEPGEPVRFTSPRLADGTAVVEGIAGGPMLLRNGQIDVDFRAEGFWGGAPPITFSQDETGDRNLLPRLAAGLDARGRLILAAIDGRNFDRALGTTLQGTARLMRALGCHTATNLDGGSSKRMVLQGRTLDLPSTEIVPSSKEKSPVRPVHTGLLVMPRR